MPTKKPSRKDSWKKLGMQLAAEPLWPKSEEWPHGGAKYPVDCGRLIRRAKALRAAEKKRKP